jgi:hypothetical protein
MKPGPPCEADSRLTIQQIPRLLRNLNAPYGVQKNPPLDPNFSQLNPIHTLVITQVTPWSRVMGHYPEPVESI